MSQTPTTPAGTSPTAQTSSPLVGVTRALIIGAGASGRSAARLLVGRGVEVRLNDVAKNPPIEDELLEQIETHFGGHPAELADGVDLIVLSPGVSPKLPLLAEARRRGIPIRSEIEIAQALITARSIAITGSNGKSTTTALIAEIGRAAGLRTEPVGNFGNPLSAVVDDSLELVAIEISSFQLESSVKFRAEVGVLLNLRPDHLDRHGTMEAYRAAKARLFVDQGEQAIAVLNADDPELSTVVTTGRTLHFSRLGPVAAGAYIRDGQIVWRPREEAPVEPILPIAALALPGPHNVENALAAVAAARAIDLPVDAIRNALRSFEGLPHRVERIATIGGVEYVNDSKATNVDATLTSIATFPGRRLWVILGGLGKGADFGPIAQALSDGDHVALLIGRDRGAIEAALDGHLRAIDCDDLAAALETAHDEAAAGDVVLLAPACASFDQFQGFADRGNRFRELVTQFAGPGEE